MRLKDSNSGYDFFKAVCAQYDILCISASGKSNIFSMVRKYKDSYVLIVADGAAFGPELERLLQLKNRQKISIYLPESFEWLILESGIIKNVLNIMDKPSEYVDSSKYFSWEQFFTMLLTERTKNTYMAYNKKKLNEIYLHQKEKDAGAFIYR